MAAPEYDFFATGPRPTPQAGATTDRFGMTTAAAAPAAPAPAAPAQQQFAPPPVAPAVNQFGLPVDEVHPTGPLAAPGYGAVPVHGGLAAGYDDAPAVWDPAASMAARAHSRAAAAPVDVRPGNVLAAGVISIITGSIVALMAGVALLGYFGAKAQIDEAVAAAGPQVQGLDDMASALLAGVLIGALVLAAMGALYLVVGIATVQGRRWGAWTLVVLSALSLVASLWQIVGGASSGATTSYGFGTWIGIGVTLTVLLLLTIGEGGRWLRRS
jgi:hypothetical protein